MTPKQMYEARKAERDSRRAATHAEHERKDIETVDLIDRLVTAIERVADSLEKRWA